jgi:hypothetical protein
VVTAVLASAGNLAGSRFVIAGVLPSGANLTGAAFMVAAVLTTTRNSPGSTLVVTRILAPGANKSSRRLLVATIKLAANHHAVPKFYVAGVPRYSYLLACGAGQRQGHKDKCDEERVHREGLLFDGRITR